jgi:hypothetical protein
MTAIIEIFFQKFLTHGESNLRTWDAFRCYCSSSAKCTIPCSVLIILKLIFLIHPVTGCIILKLIFLIHPVTALDSSAYITSPFNIN